MFISVIDGPVCGLHAREKEKKSTASIKGSKDIHFSPSYIYLCSLKISLVHLVDLITWILTLGVTWYSM